MFLHYDIHIMIFIFSKKFHEATLYATPNDRNHLTNLDRIHVNIETSFQSSLHHLYLLYNV
jgi:hypothetical protein